MAYSASSALLGSLEPPTHMLATSASTPALLGAEMKTAAQGHVQEGGEWGGGNSTAEVRAKPQLLSVDTLPDNFQYGSSFTHTNSPLAKRLNTPGPIYTPNKASPNVGGTSFGPKPLAVHRTQKRAPSAASNASFLGTTLTGEIRAAIGTHCYPPSTLLSSILPSLVSCLH
jgi:hypothetical protein